MLNLQINANPDAASHLQATQTQHAYMNRTPKIRVYLLSLVKVHVEVIMLSFLENNH